MKTVFYWGWRNNTPTEDKLMTRHRMAKLFRSWRRSKTQGSKDFDVKLIKRECGKREYVVNANAYKDESAIIVISEVNQC